MVMKSVPRNTPVTPSKPRRATARGLWLLSTGVRGERQQSGGVSSIVWGEGGVVHLFVQTQQFFWEDT